MTFEEPWESDQEKSEFYRKVIEEISGVYHTDIRIHSITKNNGIIMDGLMIKDDTSSVSPTIYLNQFFADYNHQVPLQYIIHQIMEIYETHKVNEVDITKLFFSYDNIAEQICFKLINYDMNQEMLKEIPHVPFLDMAIVFYYVFEHKQMGNGSITIRNEHLKMWKVEKNRVIEDAVINTPNKLKAQIFPMMQILEETMGHSIIEENEWQTDLYEDNICPMYVLTNETKMNGAACILYPQFAQNLPKEDIDYYILPSSIHEVILLPAHEIQDEDDLQKMVYEVNETQVEPEEVLSNHVYYYSCKSGKIAML